MKEFFEVLGSIILFVVVIYILVMSISGQQERCENNGGRYIDNFGLYDSCIYE